jgi:hypothetical protein
MRPVENGEKRRVFLNITLEHRWIEVETLALPLMNCQGQEVFSLTGLTMGLDGHTVYISIFEL